MSSLNFSNARVLVVGDVIFDQYFQGAAQRISPEAPVPVVLVQSINGRLGGAANVALNVKSLGAFVTVLGVIGNDNAGEQLKTLLTAENIQHYLLVEKDKKTIHKLRILSQRHQMMRLDQEESLALHNQTSRDLLLSHYEDALDEHDIVILSDYAKGTLAGLCEEFINRAKAKHKKVVVDPKSVNPSQYGSADIVTPNLKEFFAWIGPVGETLGLDLDLLETKAQKLLSEHNVQAMVITRSENGISLIQQNLAPQHIPAQAKEVCDVTGAGDTVIAVLATALASHYTLPQAVRLANCAAGIVVGKLGTATVSLPELSQTLGGETEIKTGVMDEAMLLEQVAAAKLRGEKIVFTNGCFDLLHAGHVTYLNEAKALGDRLIVAINTDSSVKKIKGESRPIHAEQDRMLLMANLKSVDWVVPFSEETPTTLIEKINPDIMVKGGDYQDIHALPGASHVLTKGGEVHILSLVPGLSTTKTIEKIQA